MQGSDTTDPIRVAVIFYSATGNVFQLAGAAVEGAIKAGAETRLRQVAELAPPEAVASNPAWAEHADSTADVAEATVDDLVWADAVLFGTPTRYGNIASQLGAFVDTTGPQWQQGLLADKVYGAFTSTATPHGGQETTLLSLTRLFHHWGGVIVPPGFTDGVQHELGNPYGASHVSGTGQAPGEIELAAARYQAKRVTETAAALVAGRAVTR